MHAEIDPAAEAEAPAHVFAYAREFPIWDFYRFKAVSPT
jgi:hypothetical protein